MASPIVAMLLPLAGFLLGGVIGFMFGTVQNNALKKYRQKQERGAFTSGWSVMPGSMRRTAYLLVLLAAVQILCPAFFKDGIVQWLISAGIVLGYGWTLMQQIRTRVHG